MNNNNAALLNSKAEQSESDEWVIEGDSIPTANNLLHMEECFTLKLDLSTLMIVIWRFVISAISIKGKPHSHEVKRR